MIKKLTFLVLFYFSVYSQPLVINHFNSDITTLSESAIVKAKQDLHIAYWHLSHGNQLLTGMTGLVTFANNGGKGLSLPNNIFAWNSGGSGGALDIRHFNGSAGNYPTFVNDITSYLNSHPEINVVMLSWCGEIDDKYNNNLLYSQYLNPMNQLEQEHPGIKFVYMTDHLDHWRDAAVKAANDVVRDFCTTNNKILYDFADIESYNPDLTFFEFAGDDCNYYRDAGNTYLGNWAVDWQNSHTINVDWYSCESAHSQPLNANQKAYTAWWLFAYLSGYEDNPLPVEMSYYHGYIADNLVTIEWITSSELNCAGFNVWGKLKGQQNFIRLNTNILTCAGNSSTTNNYKFVDHSSNVPGIYVYKIEEVSISGKSSFYDEFEVDNTINVTNFFVGNIYPNPFNATVSIRFHIPNSGSVKINLFNNRGQHVANVYDSILTKGIKCITLDLSNNPSGVYYCSINFADRTITKRIVLLK